MPKSIVILNGFFDPNFKHVCTVFFDVVSKIVPKGFKKIIVFGASFHKVFLLLIFAYLGAILARTRRQLEPTWRHFGCPEAG